MVSEISETITQKVVSEISEAFTQEMVSEISQWNHFTKMGLEISESSA